MAMGSLAGGRFVFADVFVRRVALDMGAPVRWIASKISPPPAAADVERQSRLDRLRGQKSVVNEQLDKQRQQTQFEPVEGFEDSSDQPTNAFDPTNTKSSFCQGRQTCPKNQCRRRTTQLYFHACFKQGEAQRKKDGN